MILFIFRRRARTHAPTNLMAIILNNEKFNPRIWIINIAPTVSYNAIPSIFIVAPIGTTNFSTLGSMPTSSKHFIVTGTVAVLNFYNVICI